MHSRFVLFIIPLILFVLSCKKDGVNQDPSKSPEPSTQKILLKDIVYPRLPSPYYHFEYGDDSLIRKASFASGYFMYDVLYNEGRIGEMRDNIIINHDTLRYTYDNTGKVSSVNFIDQNNVLKRHVFFQYYGAKLSEITWDHVGADNTFLIDRSVTFTYHPDGNLKEMTDFRPASPGVDDISFTTHFDDYDDQISVDDFTLIHDGIHDHLMILPGLNLQHNNPRKEWVTGITEEYTVTYTFTYNADHTPQLRSGKLTYTSGTRAGQQFEVSKTYSYY